MVGLPIPTDLWLMSLWVVGMGMGMVSHCSGTHGLPIWIFLFLFPPSHSYTC
ncbi:hypothetical protein L208DRAFT_771680 [Tricholoma matsutake]|nr:hypothetical protein L208DRAFT_771680 [Tricholoma matsutake 945]